jgi:hypothetical protein
LQAVHGSTATLATPAAVKLIKPSRPGEADRRHGQASGCLPARPSLRAPDGSESEFLPAETPQLRGVRVERRWSAAIEVANTTESTSGTADLGSLYISEAGTALGGRRRKRPGSAAGVVRPRDSRVAALTVASIADLPR